MVNAPTLTHRRCAPPARSVPLVTPEIAFRPGSTSARTTFFFFFNETAATEIYTLSLHDALPIFFIQWRRLTMLVFDMQYSGFVLVGWSH